MTRYRPARRHPVQEPGIDEVASGIAERPPSQPPLGSFVSSSPLWRSGRQADSTTANRPPWPTRPLPDGTRGLFARHPFGVRRAVLRPLSLGKQYIRIPLGIRCPLTDASVPAGAPEFSLLPAENPSGNWVKVVQHIPLRVQIDTINTRVCAQQRCAGEVRRSGAGDGRQHAARPHISGDVPVARRPTQSKGA